MKKLLGILVLGLILFTNSAEAGKRTSLKKGHIFEGDIFWTSRIKFDLPDGKWKVVDRWSWSVNAITARGVTLAQLNGNVLDGIVEFEEVNVNAKWISYVKQWLMENFFKNEHDGCYQRPEYYLLKVKKTGGFFNCFKVRHEDTEKLLYSPDDKQRKIATAVIRRWLTKDNIEVPKIMISRFHGFFAPSVKDSYYGIFHVFNPETHGAPKNKFFSEITSEYHRSNIHNFPKKKKYMDDFVSVAAYEHQKFEEMVRAKSNHLLDFSNIEVEKPIKETKTTISSSSITDQLNTLNNLYKEGAITKKEFEKAKKKVLSQ